MIIEFKDGSSLFARCGCTHNYAADKKLYSLSRLWCRFNRFYNIEKCAVCNNYPWLIRDLTEERQETLDRRTE